MHEPEPGILRRDEPDSSGAVGEATTSSVISHGRRRRGLNREQTAPPPRWRRCIFVCMSTEKAIGSYPPALQPAPPSVDRVAQRPAATPLVVEIGFERRRGYLEIFDGDMAWVQVLLRRRRLAAPEVLRRQRQQLGQTVERLPRLVVLRVEHVQRDRRRPGYAEASAGTSAVASVQCGSSPAPRPRRPAAAAHRGRSSARRRATRPRAPGCAK